MRVPTLTWVGYNIIRLSALAFLVWGLVAQFITMANDLKEYSATKKSSSSSSLAVPSLSIQDTDTTSNDSPLVTGTSTSTPTLVTAEEATSTLTSSETLVVATETTPIHDTAITTAPLAIAGTLPENESARVWTLAKRDNSESEGYYGSSAIPRQAGGALFAVLSRLLFVVAMSLLCIGQLGWPEQWLYDHMPLFGATSTPIWVGTGETVIGILNLAIHAKSAVLIPAWCIAVVGLLNILSGAVLLFLGRRLPKNPPPAMYFHLATRFLYWTEPSGVYRRLSDPKEAAQSQADELEKGISHRSNASELGLDDDDDDDDDADVEVEDVREGIQERTRPHDTSQPIPIPRMQIRHEPLPEQDIRNGGYPTFSGRGLTDPASQVPKGVLDVDRLGRIKGFVREDAGRKERERIVEMTNREKAESQRITSRRGHDTQPLTRTVQEKPMQTVKLAKPPSRTDRTSRATSSISTDPPMGIPKASQPLLPSQIAQQQPTGNGGQIRTTKRAKIPNPLTPINEEPASALPYVSPSNNPPPSPDARSIHRKSFSAAASDLAPKFPLPPTRTPHKANRESIVSDELIRRPPSVVLAHASAQPRPSTQLRLPPQRERSPTFAAPPPPPHTPNSTVPSAPVDASSLLLHYHLSERDRPACRLPRTVPICCKSVHRWHLLVVPPRQDQHYLPGLLEESVSISNHLHSTHQKLNRHS
ncbi:hypothetical protein BCR39DRAFT_517488 [Naematelia encephala]|uniref:Uncharacterized protein n=1 Tax=Naematelia encephala TaxID=71784 RepID=A0A1Y2BHM8_9TREE|nr:hypothetical protein BCR39DRAFT_517488 [Naematelia encephala]